MSQCDLLVMGGMARVVDHNVDGLTDRLYKPVKIDCGRHISRYGGASIHNYAGKIIDVKTVDAGHWKKSVPHFKRWSPGTGSFCRALSGVARTPSVHVRS